MDKLYRFLWSDIIKLKLDKEEVDVSATEYLVWYLYSMLTGMSLVGTCTEYWLECM